VVISFAAIGLAGGSFNELTLQDTSGANQARCCSTISASSSTHAPGPVSVASTPRSTGGRSPRTLFGVNFATAQQLADVGYTVNRWGGNRTSRYNWQLDVDSSAGDWFFTNYTASEPAPPLPAGSAADDFVLDSRAADAEVVLTLPTLGRVAGPDRERRWSFSELAYGPQSSDECRYFGPDPGDWPPWCNHDAGNGQCDPAVNTTGFCSAGGLVVGNDPDDTSIVVDATFLADWVAFVASRAGAADAGGVRFLALDNEPMLWNSTHRDVHPAAPTYEEVWTKGQAVAGRRARRRAVGGDPRARHLGVVRPLDLGGRRPRGLHRRTRPPGPRRHALRPVYLAQVCAHQQQTGVRLVDYLDVHWYPQAAGVAGTDNVVNEGSPRPACVRCASSGTRPTSRSPGSARRRGSCRACASGSRRPVRARGSR